MGDATAVERHCDVCGEPFGEYDRQWWWSEGEKALCRHYGCGVPDPQVARITELEADLARLRAENEALKTDLAIANRGGLDLLYAIRGAIGWTDKHGLSLMPAECARLYRAAKKNAPIWPGRGYDHSQSGGFDGPTGAD